MQYTRWIGRTMGGNMKTSYSKRQKKASEKKRKVSKRKAKRRASKKRYGY